MTINFLIVMHTIPFLGFFVDNDHVATASLADSLHQAVVIFDSQIGFDDFGVAVFSHDLEKDLVFTCAAGQQMMKFC